MAVEDGKGALFNNPTKKGSQPDYTGNVDLPVALLEELLKEARKTGVYKARLAAWIKAGQKGKFLSVSLNAPFAKSGAPTRQDDNERPF